MKKKTYSTPVTERVHIATMSHLLNWSAPRDEGNDGDEAEAKQNICIDDEDDISDDEELIPHWSFNVWED